MSLHIQIEKFEGPLGLLLYLIRKEEMDIFDINVHHITQQYFEYIKAMKKLDLEVAGDFIAMAATLIHIKSRMLLPQYDEHGEEVEEDDPRKALVQKLLEYEQFQEASRQLYDRPLVGRDVYLRGSRTEVKAEDDDEIIVEENPLFGLIRCYRYAVKSMKKTVHKVLGELQSISERVSEMKHRFVVGQTVRFSELLEKTEDMTNHVLITFLSFLELGKLGYVSLYQSAPLEDIHVRTLRPIDDDIIENSSAYNYVAESNIMENTGQKVQVDLSEEDLEDDLEDDLEEAPKEDDNVGIEEEQNIYAGEEVQAILEAPEEELPFKIEAATDEEILQEEMRLEIASNPINEPSDGEVEI